MKSKKPFYIIEICLMIISLVIGIFEDAFILPAFIITTIYNLLYVMFFRMLTGEKLLVSIANIVLHWAIALSVIIVGYMLVIFVVGYTDYGWFGGEGTTYYGVNAWLNNLGVIVFAPVALINIVYIVIYFLVIRKMVLSEKI